MNDILISMLSGSIAGIGSAAFLIKILLNNFLKKNLEELKADLEKEKIKFQSEIHLVQQQLEKINNDRYQAIKRLWDAVYKLVVATGKHPSSEKNISAIEESLIFIEELRDSEGFHYRPELTNRINCLLKVSTREIAKQRASLQELQQLLDYLKKLEIIDHDQ